MEKRELTAKQIIPFIGSIEVQVGNFVGKLVGYQYDKFTVDCTDCELDSNEKNITPICRPFSHLTKEIEVDGERFVPVERLVDGTVYDHYESHGTFIELYENGVVNACIWDSRGELSFWGPSLWGRQLEIWAFPHLLPAGTWKSMEDPK